MPKGYSCWADECSDCHYFSKRLLCLLFDLSKLAIVHIFCHCCHNDDGNDRRECTSLRNGCTRPCPTVPCNNASSLTRLKICLVIWMTIFLDSTNSLFVLQHQGTHFVFSSPGRMSGELLSYPRRRRWRWRARARAQNNFNLAYNSWTTIGRAFIFHMCIPCDKTFPWVPKFLT